MKVAIHQPSYFAWLGYFQKIVWSDVFVYHDDIPIGHGKKFSNRVQVNDNETPRWLTLPIKHTPETKLYELELNNLSDWRVDHLNKLENYYRKAKYFDTAFPILKNILISQKGKQIKLLADYNIYITEWIGYVLGLERKTVRASELNIQSTDKQDVIIEIIEKVKGMQYLSGTGAKEFQNDDIYKRNGIELTYQDTSKFNQYSILDYLFNVGIDETKKLLNE